jgi:hypothetical protein
MSYLNILNPFQTVNARTWREIVFPTSIFWQFSDIIQCGSGISFQGHTESPPCSHVATSEYICMDGHTEPEPHTQKSYLLDVSLGWLPEQDVDLACAVLHNVGIERNDILRNLDVNDVETEGAVHNDNSRGDGATVRNLIVNNFFQ